MNKVIAISGKPGSGKTTVGEKIVNIYDDMIYFDFGYLFRPLTYFLVKESGYSNDEIKLLIDDNQYLNNLNISVILKNKICEFVINDKYYTYQILNNEYMDNMTVEVGSMIGDKLNFKLADIIDRLKINHNLLVNARRPVAAYPDLDLHIFLEATFDERAIRKASIYSKPLDVVKQELAERDKKEKENGYWEIFPFTQVIDTTYFTQEKTLYDIMALINKTYKDEEVIKYELRKRNMR